MATDHILTKIDQKTNIIILTENNELLNTIISIIEKAKNCDELSNVTKHITTESNEQKTQVSYKRRKADLTCVVCNDKCSGYNFNVISCESFCQQHSLTFDEHNLLNSIQISYEKNFRFSTIQNDTSVFDRIIDRRSGLLYTASLFYDISLKIITFIRSIPEFELLNEQDRFILVKYNSPLVFFMRLCLHYDMQKDLIIDCQAENEERAMLLKQLSYYCFGDPLELLSTEVLRSIKKITDDDPNILQLMLIILTFAKSVSAEDIVLNEQPILVNSKQVYEIQSIYTNLLFRYMIEKYSTYNQAIRHYSQLIQKILQMQVLIRNYQEFLHEQLTGTSDDEVNPIIKSILRLC
ncbi:hypothetical protein I4U23_004847 [Adineta vaga]|nr:hypothetical protein I4U23_004847 [Adineta vaga]